MSLRRRMLSATETEDEEVREWQTIVDMVTEEELSGSGNDFVFTTMPDGTPIEGKGFREIAVYYKYNANSDGTSSGYITTKIVGVNGATTSAQSTAGIPTTGYRRGYASIVLGSLFNQFVVQQSVNTAMQNASFYESSNFIDEIRQIQMISYAKLGVGSELKIMGR